ncbi:sugar transferase [Mycobacterium sp. NAZ190054]|uniref:sugar transferase n=1 Tax=Mycobacterium sp. NAZ190054 TaxID=1747766 RepID=UPI000793147F|nr:sugar transferase [Mycobacterium sp. NAZ190054]KWX64279.1 UDP-phosphate galactose phosphotransferase [Mycobacterium sp. NAZ190054]
MIQVTDTIDSRRTANIADGGDVVTGVPVDFGQLRKRKAWETVVGPVIDLTTGSVAVGMTWATHLQYDLPPIWMLWFFAPTNVALSALRGLYRRSLERTFLDELPTIQAITALAAVLLLSGLVLSSGAPQSAGNAPESADNAVARTWMCAAILVPLGRLLWFTIKRYLFRRDVLTAPTLIVGNGRIAAKVADRLEITPEYGLRPVGLVDDDLPSMGIDRDKPSSIPYLGRLDRLDDAITRTGAECMIVAFSRTRDDALSAAVRTAHDRGVAVWIVPRIFDTIGVHARIDHIGGLPLIAAPRTDPRGWQFVAKHVSDRVVAALGLALISPVFVTLMLLVRLSSPGPVFFGQPRVGRDGRVFMCLKFRSMRPPSDSDAAFTLDPDSAPGGVEGEDRRTKIGKIMRATSLDELPQLINVLRGEMSLVGPRPERPEYVDLFNIQIARYGDRHRVKAGITGWAQVHGLRGQTSIADRAEWDNFYIENWSLWLDWKILAMTVGAVLRRAE